jgi:pimeloyl-ACP methyl ester carboxylesterase
MNRSKFKKSRFLSTVYLAITAFALGGCGGGSDSSTPSGRIDISNISTSVTPVACPENFPNAICGTITVPLDYRAPNADKIRVGFIRYKAKDPKADGKAAIHFVNGGPGEAWSANTVEEQFEAFRTNAPDRDILLIEPRGVGFVDRLSCPARLETLAVEPLTLRKQIEACAQSVGPRGSNYTTANTAHDFALVTRSLGYTQVDLFGISYGTFLSSIYASLHPERIRTLALDGAFAITESRGDNAYKSTRRIINDLCSRSGTCKGDDVWFELGKLAEGLRKSPRILQRQNGTTTETFTLDATTLAALSSLPPTITADENGKPTIYSPVIDSILQASRGNWSSFEKAFLEQSPVPSTNTEGLKFSIFCNDYSVPWNRSDSVETKQLKQRAAEAAVPAGKYLPFTAAEYQLRPSNYLYLCALWQPTTPNPAEDPANLNLSWPDSLPVLVINGDLDGQTPIESAISAAAQFKKSTFIRTRNGGHVVTPSNSCVQSKVLEFWFTKGVTKPEECLDSDPKEVVIGQLPGAPAGGKAKLGSKKLWAHKP